MRPPDVRIVPSPQTPLVFGLLRPRLLLPERLVDRWDPSALRCVLLHELAHLRRRDHWTGYLELVATCIWWWNPLVWLTRRQLRRHAEMACDAWVVWAEPDDRRTYAEALLDASEEMVLAPAAPGAASCPRKVFERRLTMVMTESTPRRIGLLAVGIVLAMATLALPGWSLVRAQEKKQEKKTEEWKRSFSWDTDLSDDILRLDIAVGVGQIRVEEHEADSLVVDAQVQVDPDEVSPDALSEALEDHVEIGIEGDTVRIRDLHREGENPWKVHVVVKTPRALGVQAITGVGALDLHSAAGDLDLQTGVGDLKVHVPGATLATVRAQSGTGKISIVAGSFEGEVHLQSGVGTVTLECGEVAPEEDVSMRTGVGAIRLRLPKETAGHFRMRTGTGEIRVEPEGAMPITKGIVGASAEGDVGGGRSPLRDPVGHGEDRGQVHFFFAVNVPAR